MERGYLEDRAVEVALLLGGFEPKVRRLVKQASDLELKSIISMYTPTEHYDLYGRRRQS